MNYPHRHAYLDPRVFDLNHTDHDLIGLLAGWSLPSCLIFHTPSTARSSLAVLPSICLSTSALTFLLHPRPADAFTDLYTISVLPPFSPDSSLLLFNISLPHWWSTKKVFDMAHPSPSSYPHLFSYAKYALCSIGQITRLSFYMLRLIHALFNVHASPFPLLIPYLPSDPYFWIFSYLWCLFSSRLLLVIFIL